MNAFSKPKITSAIPKYCWLKPHSSCVSWVMHKFESTDSSFSIILTHDVDNKRGIQLFRLGENPAITPIKVTSNHTFLNIVPMLTRSAPCSTNSAQFSFHLTVAMVTHLWWLIQRCAIVGGCVCVLLYLSVVNDVEDDRGDYAADGIGQHKDHHILPSPQRDLLITAQHTHNTH